MSSATPPSPAQCRAGCRSDRLAGKICAAAIAALLAGKTPAAPTLTSICFSLLAYGYAISQRGTIGWSRPSTTRSDPGIIVSPLAAARCGTQR